MSDPMQIKQTACHTAQFVDILYSETKDLMHDRLGRAAIRLASIWQYCWEQAGKPNLP